MNFVYNFLNSSLQLLIRFVQNDIFYFVIYGLAIFALYGIICIIFNLIYWGKRF